MKKITPHSPIVANATPIPKPPPCINMHRRAYTQRAYKYAHASKRKRDCFSSPFSVRLLVQPVDYVHYVAHKPNQSVPHQECSEVHRCTAFLLGWLHYTPIHHEKQCTDCTNFMPSFCAVRRETRPANASIAYQRRRHHCDCD